MPVEVSDLKKQLAVATVAVERVEDAEAGVTTAKAAARRELEALSAMLGQVDRQEAAATE